MYIEKFSLWFDWALHVVAWHAIEANASSVVMRMTGWFYTLSTGNEADDTYISLRRFVTISYLRTRIYFGVYGSCCTACCLCVMPGTEGHAWRSVGWMNRPGWTAPCVSVRCCETVGEYYDIKQCHSGLCALTQGTLCSFLQGWGDEGEDEWEVVVGGTVCWELAFWTAVAVSQMLSPRGKVMGNTIGRPLHENNWGIYTYCESLVV